MQAFLSKSLILSVLALGVAVIGQNASADPGDNLHWFAMASLPNNVAAARAQPARPDRGQLDGTVSVDQTRENRFLCPWPGARRRKFHRLGFGRSGQGTLVCDTDGSASGGNSVLVDTPLVDLDEDGDAKFHGNVGAFPAVCTSEPDIAFLIRTGSGRWIANGTVLH
jgi:hypothetical protein